MLTSSKPSQKSTLGNNLPFLCHQNDGAKIELNQLYKPNPRASNRNGHYQGGLAKIKGAATIAQPSAKDHLGQNIDLMKKLGTNKNYSSNLQTLIQKNQMKKRLQHEQNEINLKLSTINHDQQRDQAQLGPSIHQRSVSYQDPNAAKKNMKSSYINFVQGHISNGQTPQATSKVDDSKINKNFNYANTQKQVQRRKMLYDYCIEQQNGINISSLDNSSENINHNGIKSSKLLIEKIRSVKNSLDLLVSEQKTRTKLPLNTSVNYQSDFTSFLKDQNLDTSIDKIDVNDSVQIQDLQAKYKAYTQNHNDQNQKLQKVISIEQLSSDQKINIENIKEMQAVDRFQIYSQLQRLFDIKELNAQKLKLADMSLNYANQLTQLNHQQNQSKSKESKEQLKNQFKELIKKAKEVKRANQLLQSMNTPFKIKRASQESMLNFDDLNKEISLLTNGPISKDRFQALTTKYQIKIIKNLNEKIYPQQQKDQDDEDSATEQYTQEFTSRKESEVFAGPLILSQQQEHVRSRSQKNRMNAATTFARTPNDFQVENLMIISQIKQDQVLPKLRPHQSSEPQQIVIQKTQKYADNENRFSFQKDADQKVVSESPPQSRNNNQIDEPSFDYTTKQNILPEEIVQQQSEVLDYHTFKEKILKMKQDVMPSYQRGKKFIKTQVRNIGAQNNQVSQKSGLNIQTQFKSRTIDKSDYTPLNQKIDAYATQNFNSNYTMAVEDDRSDRSEDSVTTNRLPYNKHAFTNNMFQQNTPTPLRNRLDRANRVGRIQILYDQSNMNRTISTNKQHINLDRFKDVKKNHLKTDQAQVNYTTMTSAVKSAMKLNQSNNNSMRTTDRIAGGGFGGYSLKGGYGMLAHRISNATLQAKQQQQQQAFGQSFLNSDNLDDLNSTVPDEHDDNLDYQKLVAGNPIRGNKTLNVKKMNLNRPLPNRYEENRAQFEADLRQNLHRQIEQQREQDRKRNHEKRQQKLKEPRRILRASEIFGKTKQGTALNTQFQSDDDVDYATDQSHSRSKIHLVTLDGPDPNSKLSDHEEDKKKLQQDEKNRIIDNILEPKKVHKYYPPRKLKNPFEDQMAEQEKLLQTRKEAQQKYSEISKNRYKQDQNEPLKYCVRPGNNSNIITRVLEESGRTNTFYDGDENLMFPGWEPADDQHDSLFNFKWKPTSCGIKYDLISKHGLKQLVNHVRNHQELTTKDRLFLNMRQFYESQKLQNVYDVVPLTIVLDYMKDNVSENVQNFLQVHKIIDKVIAKSEKNNTNLADQVKDINNRIVKYTNQTQKNLKSIMKITECQHNKQNLWLLKPTGFNRGIGIHIFQNFDQLCEIMANHYSIGRGSRDRVSIFQPHKTNINQDNSNKDKITSTTFVIQKLIERPLLFHQRKFDIRVWVILNTSDGKCYLFKEGYVRTSSKIYKQYDPDISNEEQIYMQLTNNAIQRNGEEYGKYEEGNIISMMQLFEYISELPQAADKNIEAISVDYQTSMIQIIQNTIKSVKSKLVMQNYTFELLGYDFILDEQLNTQLIEVNTNPCLEESNALLKSLIPRMIDDLLNIVSDPIFNHQNLSGSDAAYKSVYPLPGELFGAGHPGYSDKENLFQHICSLQD